MKPMKLFLTAGFALAGSLSSAHADTVRWSPEKANSWYDQQRWLVGSNFLRTDAINQFEMWQADTFNPAEIDKEFGDAEGIGMNTMRIFLHDQLWQQVYFPARLGERKAGDHSVSVIAASCS